jgi:hypothetical protein
MMFLHQELYDGKTITNETEMKLKKGGIKR